TLVGNTEGVYWHGEPGSQSQKVLFSGGYWFDNLSDIVWSDNGESDSVIYTHNKTVASGGVKFFVDHRGRNFTFTGNQFSYMGAPLSVYIEYGAERLSQVFVTGNQFMDAGRGVYVSNQTNSPLPDTLDVKGNTFVGGSRSYSPTIPLANINLYGGGNHISVVGNEISHGVNVSGIRFVGGPLVEHAQPFYNLRVTDNKVYALSGNDGTGTVSAVHFYNMPSNSTMMNAAASPAMPFVEFNAFYSNEGPGITYTKGAYDPLAHIEANHNWWGDPAGPTGPNGDGVVGDVLVDTWLAGLPQYLNLPLVIRY
ncbi:MAG: hypothetical protein JXB35_09265, partial [Anaerolineae bacterium]|nr:hypothetical protein [Anaerolineae bacterium]